MSRTSMIAALVALVLVVPAVAQDNDTWQSRFPHPATGLTASGPTGGFYTPTTDTCDRSNVQFGTHWIHHEADCAPKFTIGATDDVELGLVYWNPWEPAGMTYKGEVLGHIKWRVLDETDGRPAVAIGAEDVNDHFAQTIWYGVVSKRFSWHRPVCVNVGYHGSDQGWADDDFFGSAQVGLTENVSVVGEWDGNHFNAFARCVVDNDGPEDTRGPIIDVGVADGDDLFGAVSWRVPY